MCKAQSMTLIHYPATCQHCMIMMFRVQFVWSAIDPLNKCFQVRLLIRERSIDFVIKWWFTIHFFGQNQHFYVKNLEQLVRNIFFHIVSDQRTSSARKTCFKGWKLEYQGYLMSGYHAHPAGTKYKWLDSHSDTLHGGQSDKNGYLFFSGWGPMWFPEVSTVCWGEGAHLCCLFQRMRNEYLKCNQYPHGVFKEDNKNK